MCQSLLALCDPSRHSLYLAAFPFKILVLGLHHLIYTSMASLQNYQALLVDEKVGHVQPGSSPMSTKRSKMLLACVFSLLFFGVICTY
jgi:hypothetical protein